MAREMKDSGIEWIGEIPNSWTISKLKYLGEYINGYAFKPDDWGPKGKIIIRIQDLTGSNDNPNYYDGEIDKRYYVTKGDILISWAATLDSYIWNGEDGLLNQHIFKAKPDESKINYDFFFWMSKVAMNNMNNDNKHGIFMQHVTSNTFGNYCIPLPSIDEQQRIADFLNLECSKIDSAIEKIQETIEEYKHLKQSVITETVIKGIRGDRPMRDSGIGWIGKMPAGWRIINAHRIISSTQNGLTRRDLEQSAGQIVLKLKNISPNGTIDYSIVNRINLSETELSKYTLQDGDFLFVRVNGSKALVGKCAIFDDIDDIVAYNDHIIRVRLNSFINRKYFRFFLLSTVGRAEIDLRTNTAAGQFTISGEGLRNITVMLPPLEEQIEIVNFLDRKCSKIDHLIEYKERIMVELEFYKQSLIYEYVTGKKEVA